MEKRDILFVESYARIEYCGFQSLWIKAVSWALNLYLTSPLEEGHKPLTKDHTGLKFSDNLEKRKEMQLHQNSAR